MFRFAAAAAGVAGAALGAAALTTQPANTASCHCQVPCGIFDDSGRVKTLREDATTIRKAMVQVNELVSAGRGKGMSGQELNQSTRWIVTKEEHAKKIIDTVSTYFLTQKVKEVKKGDAGYQHYLETLALHHQVMRDAMKAKQTVDLAAADNLDHSISHLEAVYKA